MNSRLKNGLFQPGGWTWVYHPTYFLRRQIFLFIREVAPIEAGRVADIGCGSKPYEPLFLNATEYIGMDIEEARNTRAAGSVDCYFDGKHIPYRDEYFDGAIASEVLEHVFWAQEWLNEVHRILKPGGYLILTCPFMFHEHEMPHDYCRYTSAGLKHVLEMGGFEVVVQRKAAPGVECLVTQWNVYVWKTIEKLPIPRLVAISLAWWLYFPANCVGLLLGRLGRPNTSMFAGNLVLCQRRR